MIALAELDAIPGLVQKPLLCEASERPGPASAQQISAKPHANHQPGIEASSNQTMSKAEDLHIQGTQGLACGTSNFCTMCS